MVPSISINTVIVKAPHSVRSATMEGSQVQTVGNLNVSTALEIISSGNKVCLMEWSTRSHAGKFTRQCAKLVR